MKTPALDERLALGEKVAKVLGFDSVDEALAAIEKDERAESDS